MFRASLRVYAVLGSLLALLMAFAAILGLASPEMYQPFIPKALLVGLPVQDAVSLLAAFGLAAAIFYTLRGSIRAFILWAGLLFYAAYYYAFFCFDPAYTPIYPIYLAIMGLGVFSLAGLLVAVDLRAFAARVDARLPVRWIALVLGMAVLFIPLWLNRVFAGMAVQQPDEGYLVYVLDLAFLVPAILFAAVQVWLRRAVGYLLSGVLLVKSAISGILLTGGSLRQMALGIPVALPELAMYVFLAVAGLGGLLLYMRHLHERQPKNAPSGARDGVKQEKQK